MRIAFLCWITCLLSACSLSSNKPRPFSEWCERDRIRASQTKELLDTLTREGSAVAPVDEKLRTKPEAARASSAEYTHLSLEAVHSYGSRIPLSLIMPKTINALVLMTSNGDPSESQPASIPGVSLLLSHNIGVAIAHTRAARAPSSGSASASSAVADIVESARALQALGYSSPKNLFLRASGVSGWSAASAALERPELFRGLILESPLLDIEHVVADRELVLRPHFVEAFGTDRAKLKQLSPLETTVDFFPLDLMMIVSLDDRTVPALGSLEWVRRLKCTHPELRSVLLYSPSEAISKERELSPTTVRAIQRKEIDFISATIREPLH